MKYIKNRKIIFSITIALIVFGVLGFENNALAAEYYVAPKTSALLNQTNDGLDIWNKATDALMPCSAGTAMANAVAGDIVYFNGGTYFLTNDNSLFYRANGALNPVSSGEEGKPIVFMASPRETPIMDVLAAPNGESGTAFGLGNQEYIIYDGFKLIANSGKKMGGIKLLGDNVPNRLRGLVVRNCEFVGGSSINSSLDNWEGLRIEQTSGAIIENCIFRSFRNDTEFHNTSALKMYFNDNLTVRNCEIYNSSCGMFLKSDTDDSAFYNNYIHNNNTGVFISTYLDRSSDNLSFYNNVFADMAYQGFMVNAEDSATSNSLKLYNNTFYKIEKEGISLGKSSLGSGVDLYNNILQRESGGDTFVASYENSYIKSADHNQWTDDFSIRIGTAMDQAYNSLAEWQSSGQLDGGENPGSGSLASNPTFINTSGNMNQLNDFRLAPDSQSKEAGREGVDMGADIELVGIQRDKDFIIRGDVDNNSDTNAIDALLTLQNSLGISMAPTAWQTSDTTGDVDCNGVSDSIDALLILRYSWGLSMENTAWCE